MAIRLSGLTSGMDTDAIVQELVSAYSMKTEKYEKQQTKLTWKQDAWKGLNTKIYGLYTNVSNMRMSSAYNLRKTTVSDNTKATVTASSSAVTGTQKLNILQTAQASYMTGAKLAATDGKTVTADSAMRDLGLDLGAGVDDTSFFVKDSEGKETEIKIKKGSTIKEVVDQLKEAGVNASFDEANQRIFVSAKSSGVKGNFELVADDANGNKALRALGLNTALVEKDADGNDVFVNGAAEYADDYALYQEALAATDPSTGNKFTSVKDYIRSYVDAYKANPDQENKFAYLVKENDTEEKLEAAILAMDRVAVEANRIMEDPASRQGAAVKITGQDAKIELNGVAYESSTNNFSINGLSITAQAETGEGDANAITISTSVDTQGIYDKIKDFLTEYNNVINEMTKLYNAESSKDYEPLTDEEKEAMSEEQIEKWESKIKDSLLRRDGNLNSIMNGMINSMTQSYEVNGKKMSLGTFGISTLGFLNAAANEQNAFHIDGDEDDENTSGKTDELRKAIEENPDELMEFMQALTKNLYSTIDEKMKSTDLSSAYKVYNDKEMDKEALRIESMIKKWEDKASDQEEYYYDKFSQMEVALSKLQNQTSSISGLLGM